uniref:COP9 signalosome complex subunit 3 N-terminal helical repeats domain-containing protein n=1 Tax=Salix viminalis TaxID=40686 RepID=A0A6N2LIG4_SALVM
MFRKASSGLLLLKKNVRSPSKAQVPDFSLPKHYRSRSRNEKAGAIQGSCIGPHDAHERDDILLDLLVVTTPMPSINTIAVEAFKKYILVSPIQNRLFSSSLPKYTSSAAQRNFENLVSGFCIHINMQKELNFLGSIVLQTFFCHLSSPICNWQIKMVRYMQQSTRKMVWLDS